MFGDRPIEAVSFDLDDTLFAYERYAEAGLVAAADRFETSTGQRVHDELLELYFDEGVTEGTFDVLVERHDLPEDIVHDLVEAFHDSTGPLEPYGEVPSTLYRLAKVFPLGLVTDGRNGRRKLSRLGLAERFDGVVITAGQDFTKRDTRPFVRVASQLGARPERMVHVGDDPRADLQAPNRLGMTTIRVRRGRFSDIDHPRDAPPDFQVDSLDGLVDILARLGPLRPTHDSTSADH